MKDPKWKYAYTHTHTNTHTHTHTHTHTQCRSVNCSYNLLRSNILKHQDVFIKILHILPPKCAYFPLLRYFDVE